ACEPMLGSSPPSAFLEGRAYHVPANLPRDIAAHVAQPRLQALKGAALRQCRACPWGARASTEELPQLFTVGSSHTSRLTQLRQLKGLRLREPRLGANSLRRADRRARSARLEARLSSSGSSSRISRSSPSAASRVRRSSVSWSDSELLRA